MIASTVRGCGDKRQFGCYNFIQRENVSEFKGFYVFEKATSNDFNIFGK